MAMSSESKERPKHLQQPFGELKSPGTSLELGLQAENLAEGQMGIPGLGILPRLAGKKKKRKKVLSLASLSSSEKWDSTEEFHESSLQFQK